MHILELSELHIRYKMSRKNMTLSYNKNYKNKYLTIKKYNMSDGNIKISNKWKKE